MSDVNEPQPDELGESGLEPTPVADSGGTPIAGRTPGARMS